MSIKSSTLSLTDNPMFRKWLWVCECGSDGYNREVFIDDAIGGRTMKVPERNEILYAR